MAQRRILPTLHDTQHLATPDPQRALMTWANQRIGVIKWQGEIWIARRGLPTFLVAQDNWALKDAPSWRSIWEIFAKREMQKGRLIAEPAFSNLVGTE